MNDKRVAYLFLLRDPGVGVRREAARRIRELGRNVRMQHGDAAVEVLCTAGEAATIRGLGMFAAVLSGPMHAEHLERLSPAQAEIVRRWNARFRRRMPTRKQPNHAKPWSAEGRLPPLPYSKLDPERVRALLEERGLRPRPSKKKPRRPTASDLAKLEKQMTDAYKDATAAYHLSRIAYRLGPPWWDIFLHLDPDILRHLLAAIEEDCWRMTGEMAVGLVFVESSKKNGPKFGAVERALVCNEIIAGLNFLADEHPGNDLSWVIDLQEVKIDVADEGGDPDEGYWRLPGIEQVAYQGHTYTATYGSIDDYREDMRVHNGSKHGLVIFVTPFNSHWYAFAGGGMVTIAKKDNYAGWGQETIDRIAAHEVSHLFGSADEYTGSGTPCTTCGSQHGCDRLPNGNCGACAKPQQDCVMDANKHRLCAYTRGHIGWAHLFVELCTADEDWAGTDDDVWLDIGDRQFVLDTPDHDDRERGNVEGHAIWAPELQLEDIKRILIRKSGDGFAGGWKLQALRVWFRGELICQRTPNVWIEDDHLTYAGCVRNDDIVNTLAVSVTTGDVQWAGTDDDVSLRLAGRSWNLDNAWQNDFERGNTDTFTLDPGVGLYRSAITSVGIHKSPDGFAGGWRLKGVRVVTNGGTTYDNQGINKWLEDDDRDWSDSV